MAKALPLSTPQPPAQGAGQGCWSQQPWRMEGALISGALEPLASVPTEERKQPQRHMVQKGQSCAWWYSALWILGNPLFLLIKAFLTWTNVSSLFFLLLLGALCDSSF